MKTFIRITLPVMLAVLLGPTVTAFSQGSEEEPNNTCQDAQDLGSVELPFFVDGSLDTPPEVPDIDFFRFTGTPGSGVRADLEGADTGMGTLPDPLLGLFDSSCNLISFNDDSFENLNSRLIFVVPPDGVFILAATGFADFGFSGDGFVSGSYRLTAAAQPLDGTIQGRVVDAFTGAPLPGTSAPFSFVELYRCQDEGCFEFVNFSIPDDAGRFQFLVDFADQPIPAGSYQIVAYAEQYQRGETGVFSLASGQHLDIGDVPLLPIPVQVERVRPCEDLPLEGGVCRYSVRFRNVTPEPIQGAAWSLVEGFFTGSPLEYTLFQTGDPKEVSFRPGGARSVSFSFRVPASVSDGAFMCTLALLGEGRRPPYFNTIGGNFLFCVVKGPDGFTVVQGLEARRLLAAQEGGRLPLHSAPLPQVLKKASGK